MTSGKLHWFYFPSKFYLEPRTKIHYLIICRTQDILRRAAALKQEQEDLAAEFAAVMADGDIMQEDEIFQMLQEEGLDELFNLTTPSSNRTQEQKFPSQVYDPTAGEIPEGILRSELERLLGLRPSDDPDDPLAHGLDFGAVEEFARSIEQGTGSFQPPADFWDAEPESGDEFLNRLNKSVENFEEMLLSKKEQARLRRERKAAGEIEDPEDSEDAFRELVNDIPMFPEDYIKNIPAPNISEKAVEQFERAERVLLILRRAFLENGVVPCVGLDALGVHKLVSSDAFKFEDPWMALDNFEETYQYLEKMHTYAGITLDLDTMFSSYYEYKPEVKCRIVVHTLMHVPLPSWYASYLELHGQPAPPPDSGPRHRRQPGEAIKISLLTNGETEGGPLIPGVLFPREVRKDKAPEEPNEKAFVKWLRRPHPVAAQNQVIVPNPTWKRTKTSKEGIDKGFEVILKTNKKSSRKKKPQKESIARTRFPNYSLLPPPATLLSKQGSGGWYAEKQILQKTASNVPPLPRPEPVEPEDLDFDPMTPDEAEQLLRQLLGNKFDDIAAQFPTKAQSAAVPVDHFQELRIYATWAYEIDPRTGRVSSLFMQWTSVGGPISDITHAYDIYLTECGLLVSCSFSYKRN